MILEIVTTEETIYSGEADILIAPGVEGQLGILPRHAPLLTAVANGVVVARKGTAEETIPVTGGLGKVFIQK